MDEITFAIDDQGYVAPIPMAIGRRFREDWIPDPVNLFRPQFEVGDRWPGVCPDMSMRASVTIRNGRIDVALGFRYDNFDEKQWAGFATIPSPLAIAVHPPLVFFMTEVLGLHAKAVYPIFDDPDIDPELLRQLTSDPLSEKELTLYGVSEGIVKAVKVGILLPAIWKKFAAAVAATKQRPTTQDYLEVDGDPIFQSASIMFSQAMREHLAPQLPAPSLAERFRR